MFPTKERAHPAMLLCHEGNYLLFDAGEGVQRQLRIKGISPMNVNDVFITHWHGDHTLGLAGMIQCMAGNRRTTDFNIYGPTGTKDKVDRLVSVFDFYQGFPLRVHDLSLRSGLPHEVVKINDLTITAMRVRHGSKCAAYCVKEDDKRRINLEYTKKFGLTQHPILGKLQKGQDIVYEGHKITVAKGTILRPGKKFCYVTDTSFFPDLVEFCEGADLLLCESTYTSEMEDKAELRNHMTAEQAGMLAKGAGVKQLVLTHFSQKFTNYKEFLAEAKKHFKNVSAARDFDEYEF
jgi:ribonuclease Z